MRDDRTNQTSRSRCLVLGSLLAMLAAASDCLASDDASPPTEFRNRDGRGVVQTAAPAVFDDSNIVWRTPIPGRGWSSPVLDFDSKHGDQIWLTTASEDGTLLSVLCLDRATGEVRQRRDLFAVAQPREKHLFNSYASPTPALAPDRIYVSWGSNGLAALDRADASTVWVRRDLPVNHYRGAGSSPILSADRSRLFLCYDGFDRQFVECLDAANGATLWRSHRPIDFGTDDGDKMKAYATPLLIPGDGPDAPPVLVVPRSFGCFAFDSADGRELWRVHWEQFSAASRPVLSEGRLIVGTGFGRGQVFAIRPGGRGDVTATHVDWVAAKTMPSKPSPVVDGGVVYGLNDKGVLVWLDEQTGERRGQLRLSGNFSASPVLIRRPGDDRDSDCLLLADESGEVIAVSLARDGDAPEIIGRSRLPDGILASPVADRSRLFLRTRAELVCIGRSEPATDPGGPSVSPASNRSKDSP